MPGTNTTQNVSSLIPEGSQLVSINVMCVVASDTEALALKQKVTEALTGVKKIRNNFTISDVPSQATPMIG